MKDHVGVIRKRLTVIEKDIDELNSEKLAMLDAGRVLADYIASLADGRKTRDKDVPKIRAALKLFGRYT